MFVSQDHFLIQCKAVAQATFIFAFSNFECSIQQCFVVLFCCVSFLLFLKKLFVRNNCGPVWVVSLGMYIASLRGTKFFSEKVPVFP